MFGEQLHRLDEHVAVVLIARTEHALTAQLLHRRAQLLPPLSRRLAARGGRMALLKQSQRALLRAHRRSGAAAATRRRASLVLPELRRKLPIACMLLLELMKHALQIDVTPCTAPRAALGRHLLPPLRSATAAIAARTLAQCSSP